MALSLSASQKNLRALFINDDRYVIPSFQRPYSWTLKEIKQLYDDITDAFDHDEDYFIGNIVLAYSNKSASHPNVVDGQQRLITLWLFIKILTYFSTNNRLKKMLEIDDENGLSVSKIESEVFEKADQAAIERIFSLDVNSLNRNKLPKGELMSTNLYKGYKWFKEFFSKISKERQDEFINYFINRVFLLPIELDGEDMEEATSRALTIFATINNRGLDLADADILKAKLYEMASIDKSGEDFKQEWNLLGKKCREAESQINDAFRYMLRIIRAKNNLTTSEPNLRNFFLNDEESPFKTTDWKTIMNTLNRIGDALMFVELLKYKSPQIALILQVLKTHSSNLPTSALVLFTYKNIENIENDEFQNKIIKFLEQLVRECYSYDPSLDLKYRIFEINACIMNNRDWISRESFFSEIILNPTTRLRNGLVLLYHYLTEQNLASQKMCTEYVVQRIIYPTDTEAIANWEPNVFKQNIDNMANFSIIDFPKSYAPLSKRSNAYNQSALSSVRSILSGKSCYCYGDFNNRQNKMLETLTSFLKDNEIFKDNKFQGNQ